MTNKKKYDLLKLLAVLIGFFLCLAVLIVSSYFAYNFYYQNKIFPGIKIGILSVGGLTQEQAQDNLEKLSSNFKQNPIKFRVNDQLVEWSWQQLGFNLNTQATINQAYQLGRSNSLPIRILEQIKLVLKPETIQPEVIINEEELEKLISNLSKKFDKTEKDASFEVEGTKILIKQERIGYRFNQDLLRSTLRSSFNKLVPFSYLELDFNTVLPKISHYQLENLKDNIEIVISQSISLEADQEKFLINPEQIGDWIRIAPTEFKQISTSDGFYAFSTETGSRLDFDREKIASYLKTIAKEINREPIDAKLTMQNGQAVIFEQNQDGAELQEEKVLQALLSVLEQRKISGIKNARPDNNNQDPSVQVVKLTVKVLKAVVTSETIESLGIKDLLGKATTNFSSSPQNRIHNLTNGTKFLNGLLVKQDEEFSTVESLGKIDDTTGYLPELVIKNNRTIPEFGGGLCQVSTTLFRAVLAAGLKVAERRNHSYRVAYYERGVGPGLDATVYLPKPDFKFYNDTPGWILIQGQVKGNEIIFELYGTADGRQSKIEGPYTLSTTPAPATIYEETDTLLEGEKKQLEKSHDGAKTIAHYTVTRNGEELFKQTFRSSYKALPARYLVGTKKVE